MKRYFLSIALIFSLSSCRFTKEFCSNPDTIGSLAPSSSFLAKKMVKLIPAKNETNVRRSFLEVGAGTGVFTEEIIAKMGKNDHLDVAELVPKLCKILHAKFDKLKNVSVLCTNVLEITNKKYDYIVSGLPFNAFNAVLVLSILNKYKEMLKPGGGISFFEYLLVPEIKSILLFLSDEKKKQYQELRNTVLKFVKKYEVATEKELLNLTPAKIYYLKIP